jgi:hypothetical protein
MGCKVKKKQCFTDYVSYLSTQYYIIFLEYGSCPVKPLLSSNSVYFKIFTVDTYSFKFKKMKYKNTCSSFKFSLTIVLPLKMT